MPSGHRGGPEHHYYLNRVTFDLKASLVRTPTSAKAVGAFTNLHMPMSISLASNMAWHGGTYNFFQRALHRGWLMILWLTCGACLTIQTRWSPSWRGTAVPSTGQLAYEVDVRGGWNTCCMLATGPMYDCAYATCLWTAVIRTWPWSSSSMVAFFMVRTVVSSWTCDSIRPTRTNRRVAKDANFEI